MPLLWRFANHDVESPRRFNVSLSISDAGVLDTTLQADSHPRGVISVESKFRG